MLIQLVQINCNTLRKKLPKYENEIEEKEEQERGMQLQLQNVMDCKARSSNTYSKSKIFLQNIRNLNFCCILQWIALDQTDCTHQWSN